VLGDISEADLLSLPRTGNAGLNILWPKRIVDGAEAVGAARQRGYRL